MKQQSVSEESDVKQETNDTGVIYKITNKQNGKFYIGRAFSYVKNGNQPLRKHSGQDRFYKHYMAAQNNSNDCPIFYAALKNTNMDDWTVETIAICSKKHLKEYETRCIKNMKSYLPEIGYNYFIADNKPDDGANRESYETKKAATNRNRAKDCALKKDDIDLPSNIYRRSKELQGRTVSGLFVQIKPNGKKAVSKGFMSAKDTDAQKLEKAVAWLNKTKNDLGIE